MRRLLCLLVLAVLVAACGDEGAAAPTSSTTAASDDGGQAVERGDEPSATSPDATVPTDDPAAGAPDDVVPGEGRDEQVVFVADLTGDAAVPPPGDSAGSGRAEIRSEGDGQLCVDMVVSGLDSDVTASHVHRGAAGAAGAALVPIGAPSRVDGDTDVWRDVCVDVDPDLVQRIADDPAGYYVNVHTETHPESALRGQLQPSSIFDLTLS